MNGLALDSIKDNEYLLITISNKAKSSNNNDYLIVEIVNKEYFGNNEEEYFMPINQYMIETFEINGASKRNYNNYYIDINDKYRFDYKNDSEVLIEFSPNYQDITLNLENNINYKYISSID